MKLFWITTAISCFLMVLIDWTFIFVLVVFVLTWAGSFWLLEAIIGPESGKRAPPPDGPP